VAVHNAEAIFEEFQRIRDSLGSQTPEEQLESYCKNVLTSVERLHFDYKVKHDRRTPQLHEDDKKNLTKALSGFANSGGGVLLWGVDEGPPLQLKPITQIETFLKNMMELGGQTTDPVVQGLDGAWLPSARDKTAGFAAVLIPESPLPPHRVLLKVKEVQHHYYIRTGSDFIVATHSQLEDMFGRRPQPKLVAQVRSEFPHESAGSRWRISFDVVNEGRGTAKLVCIQFLSQPGMLPWDGGDWRHFGRTPDATTGQDSLTFELIPTMVIHPGMARRFSELYLDHSYFSSGQSVELSCILYCEGCAPVRTTISGTLQT